MAFSLFINGVPQDLAAKRLSLDALATSWDSPRELRFTEHAPHNAASYGVEDAVELSVDGAVRFRGRIKRVELAGVPGAEQVAYTCLGLRELAKDVWVRDPASGSPRVVFNAPEDDEDYDASLSGLTIGEIIAWLFDEHAALLRAAGAIALAPADGYVRAELDALGVVPPKVVLDSVHFDDALQALLRFQPAHRLLADPATQTFRFREVAALPTKTLMYNSADRPLLALLRPSTEGRATAVEICGPMRPVNETLYLSTGGLMKLWNPGLEADWTWAKCFDPANSETYGRVYRRFQIADAAKRRIARSLAEPAALGGGAPARCPQVYRKTPSGAWALVPSAFDFANGVIMLAQPATVGDEYAEGGAACTADICLVYAYLAEPLSIRRPASGYEGTAYTRPTNPVRVVRRFYDEDFVLPAQAARYADIAAQLLAAYKDTVFRGTVRLGVLDWSLADLSCRVCFAAKDDVGEPVETGFETLGAVLLRVVYDFRAGRTELVLSTDTSAFVGLPSWQVRELLTQARRAERHRALQASGQLPTPRVGNDGEVGAATDARGVYSIRRYEDGEAGRVAGHIDLEAGDGVAIERQVDANHNGFRISAAATAARGSWFWFERDLTGTYANLTITDLELYRPNYDGTSAPGNQAYPVGWGRVQKMAAWFTGTIGDGVEIYYDFRCAAASGACPDLNDENWAPLADMREGVGYLDAAANIGLAEGIGLGIPGAARGILGARCRVIVDLPNPPGSWNATGCLVLGIFVED